MLVSQRRPVPLAPTSVTPTMTASASVQDVSTGDEDEEEGAELRKVKPLPHVLEEAFEVVEAGTIPGIMLVAATVLSLTLANLPATSAAWLGVWTTHLGPAIGGHALTLRAWINEGLMAIFFFVVGLEIKQELRLGSLASIRKAILPCIAALGGMVTPMAVYFLINTLMPGGSLIGLAIPMATDIAFAMAVFGFFRSVQPRP